MGLELIMELKRLYLYAGGVSKHHSVAKLERKSSSKSLKPDRKTRDFE
jgi:hypothetical protein